MGKILPAFKSGFRKLLVFVDSAACFALYYSGFLHIYTKIRNKERVTILFYHEIGGDESILGGVTVRPGTFERQLEFVSRLYNFVSMNEFHRFLKGEATLPPNALIITFDGGFKGNYKHAFPILRRFQVPATIYLVMAYIERQVLPWTIRLRYAFNRSERRSLRISLSGSEREFNMRTPDERTSCAYEISGYLMGLEPETRESVIGDIIGGLGVGEGPPSGEPFLGWDEIRRMCEDGLVEFGSHTLTHPNLAKTPLEDAEREIKESKGVVEKHTGLDADAFCYPYGYFSEAIKSIVREAGYVTATTTEYGLNNRETDPYELKRIGVREMPMCVFASEISGLYRVGAATRLFGKIMGSKGDPVSIRPGKEVQS